MAIRPTQASTFAMIRMGLMQNFSKLATAQEQVATGKRIRRPSDDPVGASQALGYRNRLSVGDRYQAATQNGRSLLDTAASNLQDASGLLAEVRATLLEAMSGTQSANDRQVHADELRLVRDRLLTIANAKSGDRYLFGGTVTGTQPFEPARANGRETVAYVGNDEQQELLIGLGETVGVGVPGGDVFAGVQRTGTQFAGLTGAASGTTADQGTGYDTLVVRHDATNAAFSNGVQLANGGNSDTFVGTHTLSIDATAGTVRFDNGPALALPVVGSPNAADFTVTNERGAEIHLDFSAWNGASSTDTVVGDGSISIDGVNWTTLDFVDPDLELVDADTGSVLHVDTTGIGRAGDELVIFGGAVNLFDVMQGIVEDLENPSGLDADEQVARLNLWLGELDRHHANVLGATGTLGARSEHLAGVSARLDDAAVEVKGLLSNVEDADYSEVVLEMSRAEQTLQLAQATSVRMIQNTLLNFLR
jgi:flagellar hook-associated protein 3 FlgL